MFFYVKEMRYCYQVGKSIEVFECRVLKMMIEEVIWEDLFEYIFGFLVCQCIVVDFLKKLLKFLL